MLTITATTLFEGWLQGVKSLHASTSLPSDQELLREEVLCLEIMDPLSERFHPSFPMTRETIDDYLDYIIEGGSRLRVHKDHSFYHERLFAFPPHKNNQVQFVIEQLKKDPNSKRAQIVLWNPDIDQHRQVAICPQIIWFRLKDKQLTTHAHLRANDAYKKLPVDLNLYIEVMKHVADQLDVAVGPYIYFVDSFHFYYEDKEAIETLVGKYSTSSSQFIN